MTQEAKKSNDAVTMTTATESNLRAKILNLLPSKRSRTVLLVVLVIIGGIVYINTNKPSKIPIFNQATILILNGGKYEDAIKLLDSAKNRTNDKMKIAEIELQKASLSISTNHLSSAMQYAMNAEAVHPTALTSTLIASIAKRQLNNQLAIKWYKTTLNRLDKNALGYQFTLQEVKDSLKDLGQ